MNVYLPILRFIVIGSVIGLISLGKCGQIEDSDENCAQWADEGECEMNPKYMLTHCEKSCDLIRKAEEEINPIQSFFELDALDIDGNTLYFSALRGKITVVVNVASYCGYTESHYTGLVNLYDELKDTGMLEILAFPCNQFGSQEPEECPQIKRFARSKGVAFRMMNKINVNGANAHKVYRYLKKITDTERISWNFATYFIISRDGYVQAFSDVEPYDLKDIILDLMEDEL